MKIDTYSKVILTGVAIFLGVIAFDYKPSIKAEAGITGGNEMIAAGVAKNEHRAWHLKDGKIRACWDSISDETVQVFCGPWSE